MPLSKSPIHVAAALALALAYVRGTTVASAHPASPQPSDSPSPVASTLPSPEPAASPSPSAPAHVAIVLDRARAGIVPGSTVTVHVTGGAGPISATASAPNVVDARYDAVAGLLSLAGRAPGNAIVTLSDAAGDIATVAVLVAPPGGVVPADVTVELGGTVSPQFAEEQIEAAIAASAQLRPGTQVVVHGATPDTTLLPGSGFEATANVRIDGGGAYVDALGTTNVHLRVDTLTELDPQILLYSDDPEKLLADTSGVLYRATIDAAKPARAYFYHVAYGSSHRLFLSLTATGADARVQILGDAAGPTDAFAYVGHISTLRYLLERHAQESRIVAVSADAPYLQALGSRELRPGELVAGAFDLRVFTGGPIAVAVIAADTAGQAATLAGGAELPTDGHGRRGEFDLTAVPPLALSLAAGAPDAAPFAIG
ncbi:MAG: hypothetical protein IAI48_04820, partial [Candidatus Eremiobacteraeota bacterium]|nr:hypothetical protein [Candidatus Eremiobacteraeota bacterium]